ncbi:MAG: dienelactone hydrolase family protein [Gemmataceae bacterium]
MRSRFAGILLLVLGAALPARAAVVTQVIEYEFDGTTMKGFYAVDDANKGPRPGVLVIHEWWGLNDYAKERAKKLAELGYAAFCVDMYGDGKTANHPDEAGKFAGAVRKNLKTWLGRAEAGLKVLKERPEVDPKKIAAIGYCFGGTTALQLALAGNDIAAVSAFHAGLPPIDDAMAAKVKGTIFIAHGADDTFIPQATIDKFRAVLDKNKTNYEFVAYPGATHSFTVPGIEKIMPKLKYDAEADAKSWKTMQEQFTKAFGK